MTIVHWHQEDTRAMDINPGTVGNVSNEREFNYDQTATSNDIAAEEVQSTWPGHQRDIARMITPDEFVLTEVEGVIDTLIEVRIRVHPNHTLDAVRAPIPGFNPQRSLELQKKADCLLWTEVDKKLELPTNECTEAPDSSVTQCIRIGNTIIAFSSLIGHDKITCAVRDHEEREDRELDRENHKLQIADLNEMMG